MVFAKLVKGIFELSMMLLNLIEFFASCYEKNHE